MRSAKAWSVMGVVLLFGILMTFPAACGKKRTESGTQGLRQTLYQCPMHPTIISDKPDNCPVCQMRLQAVAPPVSGVRRHRSKKKVLFYQHPMRPEVTSPTPRKDEMGMDYIPVAEGEEGGLGTPGALPVPGHAVFTLPIERQQLIGVRIAPVKRQPLVVTIRSVGRVAYDPELYSAIAEYREAVRAHEQAKRSPWPDVLERAGTLVRSARVRLTLLGLSESQVAHLAQGGSDPLNLLLPQSTAWIYVQIYEHELILIRPGQRVEVTAPALSGQTLKGKVVSSDPVLDATTRTAKVRVEVPNRNGRLRPEMYVHAIIQIPLGKKLAIPKEAVLLSGERAVVFVVKDGTRFEPRAVTLGQEADQDYEILTGLQVGESIVTSANFLIDSESRLRAALSAFQAPPNPQ